MLEETNKTYQEASLPSVTSNETDLSNPLLNLDEETKSLIAQIVNEKDESKSRDLTQLFNINQNKKTLVRVDKLSTLLDIITDQAVTRFTARPDEISNKDLFDGLKIIQDLIERGQKQTLGVGDTPLIQVNQQTNEVNIGNSASSLNKESRERVKSAVLSLLDNIVNNKEENLEIVATAEPETEEEKNIDE